MNSNRHKGERSTERVRYYLESPSHSYGSIPPASVFVRSLREAAA